MIRNLAVTFAAALAFTGAASAGAPPDTVHWTASLSRVAGNSAEASLQLTAAIDDGWHVYGLEQLEGGPIPLSVKLDPNDVADAAGKASGSAPEKIHDPRFDLDTQFYTHAFSVSLPLKLRDPAAGGSQVPVSIRFQTCRERECQPPKTIHLTAAVGAPSP